MKLGTRYGKIISRMLDKAGYPPKERTIPNDEVQKTSGHAESVIARRVAKCVETGQSEPLPAEKVESILSWDR